MGAAECLGVCGEARLWVVRGWCDGVVKESAAAASASVSERPGATPENHAIFCALSLEDVMNFLNYTSLQRFRCVFCWKCQRKKGHNER